MYNSAKLKIILIGAAFAGKTSLIRSYVDNIKCVNNFSATVAPDMLIKETTIDSNRAIVAIWDTAGQEKYSPILTKQFLRGCSGCILVCDVSDFSSLKRMTYWKEHFMKHMKKEDVPICVALNKCDKSIEQHQITHSIMKQWVIKHHIPHYFTTSATENKHVQTIFDYIIRKAYYNWKENEGKEETVDKPVQIVNLKYKQITKIQINNGAYRKRKNYKKQELVNICSC